MGRGIVRVYAYPPFRSTPHPDDYYVFESKDDHDAFVSAGANAQPLLAAFHAKIQGAGVVVLACNAILNTTFTEKMGGALRLGEWRAWPARTPTGLVFRAPSNAHMYYAWAAAPADDGVFRGGVREQHRRLCVATPMTLRTDAATFYFATPRANVAPAAYTAIAEHVLMAGFVGTIEKKHAARVRALAMPFLRMGDYPLNVAHQWDEALRGAKKTMVIVAPAPFLADVLRYIHALRSPQEAGALTANAFFAAFGANARMADQPTLRPREIPPDAGVAVR